MQHVAWILAPLVLIAVLGFSASAKLGQGASLRSIVANLRLPLSILPTWLAKAIPAIELALCVGLLAPWAPVFLVFSIATLVLVFIYWLLIARGMTITPRPSCGCFGNAGDHRISWRTLLRNTLLVGCAGAAVALAASGRTVWSLVADAAAGDWLWLGLAVVASAVTGLVLGGSSPAQPSHQPAPPHAAQPVADQGPEAEVADDEYIRVPIPQVLLLDIAADNNPVTLHELAAQRAQLLIFVNCYCGPTHAVAAALAGWQERLPVVDVRMVFSTAYHGSTLATPPKQPLLDHGGFGWRALELAHSPSAVLLGADGHLAGGPVQGMDEINTFVDDIEQQLNEAGVVVEGELADDVHPSQGEADPASTDSADPVEVR